MSNKAQKNKNWEDPLEATLTGACICGRSRPFSKNESEKVFSPYCGTPSGWEYVGDATWKLSLDGVSRHAKILHLPIPASLKTADCTMHRNSNFFSPFV